MKLTSKPLAAIILVILFGGIFLTTALNWWTTETTKVPAVYTSGDSAGQYNPADIRGSYTFGDIENSFGVPADVLAKAFELPAETDAAAFQLKTLEDTYAELAEAGTEVGTASVRYFVALYKHLPFTVDEGTWLLKPAVDILKGMGSLDAEDLAYLETHTIDLNASAAQPVVTETAVAAQPAPSSTVHVESADDRTVKGKTTFADVLGWGVSQSTIEQVIGKPMPNKLTLVKTFCDENGIEFVTIKDALQAEVDKLQP